LLIQLSTYERAGKCPSPHQRTFEGGIERMIFSSRITFSALHHGCPNEPEKATAGEFWLSDRKLCKRFCEIAFFALYLREPYGCMIVKTMPRVTQLASVATLGLKLSFTLHRDPFYIYLQPVNTCLYTFSAFCFIYFNSSTFTPLFYNVYIVSCKRIVSGFFGSILRHYWHFISTI
jgi:hypothetical protein